MQGTKVVERPVPCLIGLTQEEDTPMSALERGKKSVGLLTQTVTDVCRSCGPYRRVMNITPTLTI